MRDADSRRCPCTAFRMSVQRQSRCPPEGLETIRAQPADREGNLTTRAGHIWDTSVARPRGAHDLHNFQSSPVDPPEPRVIVRARERREHLCAAKRLPRKLKHIGSGTVMPCGPAFVRAAAGPARAQAGEGFARTAPTDRARHRTPLPDTSSHQTRHAQGSARIHRGATAARGGRGDFARPERQETPEDTWNTRPTPFNPPSPSAN
jgi:hypothetical protein